MNAVWILVAVALGHVLAGNLTEADNDDLLAHYNVDQQYIEEPSLNSESFIDGEHYTIQFPYPIYIKEVNILANQIYLEGTVAIKARRYSLSENKRVPVEVKLPCLAHIISVKVKPTFYVEWFSPIFSYIDLSEKKDANHVDAPSTNDASRKDASVDKVKDVLLDEV